jgi:hypothetical protein
MKSFFTVKIGVREKTITAYALLQIQMVKVFLIAYPGDTTPSFGMQPPPYSQPYHMQHSDPASVTHSPSQP